MRDRITLDFETRSHASLKAVGAWKYSVHPTTDVMCLGWHWEHGCGQWRMGQPPPEELFHDIKYGAQTVEAHNSFFEFCVWLNVCHKRYGWPAMPFEMWRCSAAKAAAVSIPRSLGDAGRVMNLKVVKDEEYGKWAMQKLSKPRKPTKNDSRTWHDDPEDWDKMLGYNLNDVASEETLSAALPELTPFQLAAWRLTKEINLRGFAVDVEGCRAAVKIAGAYAQRLTTEFSGITGLDTAGQRAKFEEWMTLQGQQVANTQAATLDDLLKIELKPQVRRAVEIVRALGRSSIKKYRSALEMEDGGRVRGTFLWHGAHTGRHAGMGLQPQNFKREGPACGMDQAWDDVLNRPSLVETLHGDPLELLSRAVRGVICAPPGRDLLFGDFAQAECRDAFWLSGERAALDVIRDTKKDIYCENASLIYNRVVTKENERERFLGKQATLALCFGAGYIKFLLHCRALGAPPFTWRQVCDVVPAGTRNALLEWIMGEGWDEVKRRIPGATRRDAEELVLTKYVVDKYRKRYKETVCKYWKTLEKAVFQAIATPGTWVPCGKVSWRMGSSSPRFLSCKLPSGRLMRYCDARIVDGEVRYMMSEGGRWREVSSYGGKWLENITQAMCGDVMTEGMLRLAARPPYHEIVVTVHDDVGVEVDEGVGDVKEFEAIMAEPPAWCADMPIKVEAWRGKRYKK